MNPVRPKKCARRVPVFVDIAGHKTAPDTAAAICSSCCQRKAILPESADHTRWEETIILPEGWITSTAPPLETPLPTCGGYLEGPVRYCCDCGHHQVAVRVASYVSTKNFFEREAARGKHEEFKRLQNLMNILNSAVRVVYFVGAVTVLEKTRGAHWLDGSFTAGISGVWPQVSVPRT